MNMLEATIKDALEDHGLYDVDEEILAHVAMMVNEYFRDEGWLPPSHYPKA